MTQFRGCHPEDERRLDEHLVPLRVVSSALTLIEDGEVGSAVVLLADVIDRSYPAPQMRARCLDCGAEFEWHGLAEAHQVKAGHFAGIDRLDLAAAA